MSGCDTSYQPAHHSALNKTTEVLKDRELNGFEVGQQVKRKKTGNPGK